MRVAVLDAGFPRKPEEQSGLAANWLKWELARANVSLSPANCADVVLVSHRTAQKPRGVLQALRVAGVAGKGQTIILGGQAAMQPAVFDGVVSACCVGEGTAFVAELLSSCSVQAAIALPCCWVPGETRRVFPCTEFPWHVGPIVGEDATVRVFASRGCRKMCAFCQVGWQMPYSEHPRPERVVAELSGLRATGRRTALVTNDVGALSFCGKIGMVGSGSASFAYINKLAANLGVAAVKEKLGSVRLGVEGVSERIRKAAGKAIGGDALVKLTLALLAGGVGVRWFMIAGMPGESATDWDELKECVLAVKRNARKGAVQVSFTAFVPEPATPLCIAPLDDGYADRYADFDAWFFRTTAFSRRVQIMKPCNPASRLIGAMNAMAATESELRRGWEVHDPPNWRVVYPHQHSLRRAWRRYAQQMMIARNKEGMDVGKYTGDLAKPRNNLLHAQVPI